MFNKVRLTNKNVIYVDYQPVNAKKNRQVCARTLRVPFLIHIKDFQLLMTNRWPVKTRFKSRMWN